VRRELEEYCPICSFPTLEGKFDFRGEKLAVCVCLNPKCDYMNWILPKGAWDANDKETPIFYESKELAERCGEEMRRKFFLKQPVEIKPKATQKDVREFLDSLRVSSFTRQAYESLLKRFIKWLGKEAEG